MRRFFADTFYWIALFNPKDAWHEHVLAFSQSVGPCHLYTLNIRDGKQGTMNGLCQNSPQLSLRVAVYRQYCESRDTVERRE